MPFNAMQYALFIQEIYIQTARNKLATKHIVHALDIMFTN